MATADTAQQPPAPHSKEIFHAINDPSETVNESMTGLTVFTPNLSYLPSHKIVYRSDLPSFRTQAVTTVAYSGGGHEPMYAGFVGKGILSCYVSGAIFASPTAAQMLEAIRMCQPVPGEGPGTLLIGGNYTGDVLNSGLAMTRARGMGYKVESVTIGDDVAVGREKGGKVGRRGLSGQILLAKIVGAAAAKGASLDRCQEIGEEVCQCTGTIGVAFDRVALPNATVTELTQLPPNTIELGMGAHGEPGLQQISPVPSPQELTKTMIDLLTDMKNKDRAFVPLTGGDTLSVMVNSLGSTSDDVLARFAELAIIELEKQGFQIVRLMFGPIVTSLKMSGFGLTIWKLPGPVAAGHGMTNDEALELWDLPVECQAWRQ